MTFSTADRRKLDTHPYDSVAKITNKKKKIRDKILSFKKENSTYPPKKTTPSDQS